MCNQPSSLMCPKRIKKAFRDSTVIVVADSVMDGRSMLDPTNLMRVVYFAGIITLIDWGYGKLSIQQ